MVVLVTPWSVAPGGVPLPHGDGSVPNISVLPEPEDPEAPEAAAAVEAVDELALDDELEPRLLLHPTATKPAMSTMNRPDRPVTRRMETPLCVESLPTLNCWRSDAVSDRIASHFTATGLTGDPTAPVNGCGDASSWNS